MATSVVPITTAQYVRVNIGLNPLVLQALRDSVRVVLSDLQPAITNPVFHLLSGKDAPLTLPSLDVNVWALAMTDRASLVSSELVGTPVVLHDDLNNPAYVDPFSGALGVIEQEHLQIHKGNLYTLGVRTTLANGGGAAVFLGIVPAGVFPHFRNITVTSTGGPLDVDLYEAPTVAANGTPLTALNNNRNSANTHGMLLYGNPTITDDGLLLEPVLIPGGKQTGSLGTDASNEWVLKQDTEYFIRVTNNTAGGGTSEFTINTFWYEG